VGCPYLIHHVLGLAGLALFLLHPGNASPVQLDGLCTIFPSLSGSLASGLLADPLHGSLIIFTLWALFRWQNTASWKGRSVLAFFCRSAPFY